MEPIKTRRTHWPKPPIPYNYPDYGKDGGVKGVDGGGTIGRRPNRKGGAR